jgi:UDP-N-acetylmuramate--alanine ligase
MENNLAYKYYFLGIGGIGMSALARYFLMQGSPVAGYDLSPSEITEDLSKQGISIHFTPDVNQIPKNFLDKKSTIVIRTPAVPDDHDELTFFIKQGFSVKKRAEVLGLLFNEQKGIAIAGTHGKTSVTSMSAYIMHRSALGCNAFLGGIMKNVNSNLILDKHSEWVVAEADEFDRSFLQLIPNIALVTWIDADHLDVYGTTEAIRESFIQFLLRVKPGGSIILKEGIQVGIDFKDKTCFTYSLDSKMSDFYALNIRSKNFKYTFDIITPGEVIRDVTLQYPGMTNIENAVAAAAVTYTAGVNAHTIGAALTDFTGVKRRFDIQFENKEQIYIDDYAHHPRELDAIIGSVRRLYPGRKLTGIFQPHLYSRTRDFADEFAESLSALDELILLDIYPAREKPIEGVSSQIIFDKVTLNEKTRCSKTELLEILKRKKIEVLLTTGAGDIDKYVPEIKDLFLKR